jgi:hypothetical protein
VVTSVPLGGALAAGARVVSEPDGRLRVSGPEPARDALRPHAGTLKALLAGFRTGDREAVRAVVLASLQAEAAWSKDAAELFGLLDGRGAVPKAELDRLLAGYLSGSAERERPLKGVELRFAVLDVFDRCLPDDVRERARVARAAFA